MAHSGHNVESEIGLWRGLWAFLRVRKKWWLGPILATLLVLAALVGLTHGAAVAPFVYTLF